MKKLWIAGIAAIGVGVSVISVASAQTSTPPRPYSNTVGIYIDSIYGDTSGTINCWTEGSNGRFETGPEGDATLFMTNRQPHKIKCEISIKRVYEDITT